jgi:protein TonB
VLIYTESMTTHPFYTAARTSLLRLSPAHRNTAVAVSVVLLHVAALWSVQTGLLLRPMEKVETIVSAQVITEAIAPPRAKIEPTPPEPKPPEPIKQPALKKAAVLPLAPTPLAIAEPTPTPDLPTGATSPQAPAPPMAAPMAQAPLAPPLPPPRIELPSSDADYLQNPRPPYPATSKRLGEQGKVVVRVLIGVDGTAQRAEIHQSSGHHRLDQAALSNVQRWRYVPGKRDGMAEAMWFNVPVYFVLE